MRYSLAALILIAVLLGCGDEYYGPTGSGGGNHGPYPVETEPSLSPDLNYIYYVSTDTAHNLYSGIYRASVGQPKREKIFAGAGLHSPSVGFDNNTVAYIDSGRIKYYRMSDMSGWPSNVTDSFGSIFYLSNDPLDILIGQRNDSIFLVTESEGAVPFIARGWDPTFVFKDTFVYLTGEDSIYHIIKSNIYNLSPDTLFTLITNAWPHWPSLERNSGWVGYSLAWYYQRFIYAAKDTFHFVDSSDYLKPLMLRYNMIIYTGPDGRFYQSNFYGTKSVPFIYVKQ
ncbi:MAG: hypothetical protein JSU69_06320 [Candidatus Zixiibacteriota bacterium]|nr:MAG: hypothetical protein JSU69_06320 [candidate division Zixibacteria bacterium]